jgi:sugar/nucleoside kinase (ribokinase family)
MVDILAVLPAPLAVGSDTPAPITLTGGGAAANTAAWLVAAGATATLVARVGDDSLGQQARAQLDAAGVDARLAVDAAARTGSCIVLVDVAGERTMVPDSGANTRLSVDDVDAELFAAGRHLHLSAYTIFHDGRAAAERALELARAAGLSVSVDAASAAPLAEFGADRFRTAVGGDLLVFANLDEARVLTGTREPAECALQLAADFGAAAVKVGSGGAYWSEGHSVLQVPTSPIEPLDTTGAGDAFAAGLLQARLSGALPRFALATANRLAAQACRSPGGRPPIG